MFSDYTSRPFARQLLEMAIEEIDEAERHTRAPGMSGGDRVVPFGKYKGQPVEVLRNDPGDLDWVTTQAWVRELDI